MTIPQGIEHKGDKVCKLNKALYGLKQTARCWFEIFEKTLLSKGFKNSAVDRCMYILNKGNVQQNIYVLLYVDDLIISCANIKLMNDFKVYLMNQFKMTDLKEVKHFLGIKIERNENSISLSQTAYINNVLNKFKMQECNPVSTPLPVKIDYELLNLEEEYNAPSRNLIGCLMYLMLCTRPDLSLSVNLVSRYVTKMN